MAQSGQGRPAQGIEGLAATPALVASQSIGVSILYDLCGRAVRTIGASLQTTLDHLRHGLLATATLQTQEQLRALFRTECCQRHVDLSGFFRFEMSGYLRFLRVVD